MRDTLPKKVTEVKKGDEEFKITLAKGGGGEKSIKASNATWDSMFNEKRISGECYIEHTGQDDEQDGGGERRKLKCGQYPSQRLAKFQITEEK